MRIITLSGSLRRASTNTALLRTAERLAPEGVNLERAEIGKLPLYNDDLGEAERQEVQIFRAQIEAADAVLISTPEYNYGIPGPLKNAIDWASRPAYQSPFAKKPVGIVGVSAGLIGSARAQGQLKQVLLGIAAQVFPYPEFLVGQSGSKFTDGELVDEDTQKFLQKFLSEFVPWVKKVG